MKRIPSWLMASTLLALTCAATPACSDSGEGGSGGRAGSGGGSSGTGGGAAAGGGSGGTGAVGASGGTGAVGANGGTGGGASDCCQPKFSGGCNDSKVQTCVCQEDSVCCDVEWDQTCIDIATTQCDLSCGGTGGSGGTDGGADGGAGADAGTDAAATCSATSVFHCGKAQAKEVWCQKTQLCFDPGLQSIAGVQCVNVPTKDQCTTCAAYAPVAPKCPGTDKPVVFGTVKEGCVVVCKS